MDKNPLSDPKYLQEQQYRSSANLDARKNLHARFSTNPYDWFLWVFDRLDLPAHAQILELGCGPGDLWLKNTGRLPAGWQIFLTDFSRGMVQAARKSLGAGAMFSYAQANAQTLPFPEGQFDSVIANHMLYHVPDREKAFQEIRRVLKPGGKLLAATNGEDHLCELQDLAERFLPETTLPVFEISFNAENGAEELSRYFPEVAREVYPDSLEVTEAEPLAAYLLSMARAAYFTNIKDLENRLVNFLRHEIEHTGSLHLTKNTVIFVAKT